MSGGDVYYMTFSNIRSLSVVDAISYFSARMRCEEKSINFGLLWNLSEFRKTFLNTLHPTSWNGSGLLRPDDWIS